VRARTILTIAIVMSVLALCPATAGSSGKPTGNSSAIALYTKAVAATNSRAALVQTVRGQYYWGYSGSGSAWRLDVDSATAPYSYEHRVNLIQTVALSSGKTTWELNEFVCPTVGGCGSEGSLAILGTASAVYWGTSSASGAGLPACWNRAAGQTAWMVKAYSPGWKPVSVTTGAGYTAQHYVSVTHHGARDVFDSTYTWRSSGVHYTEVDTVEVASNLFVGSTYRVATSPGHPAYSFSSTYSYPSAAPTPPTTTMCGSVG